MRCRIRRRTHDGAWTESTVESPMLTVGRGTHNDIELAGLLVAQEHAQISQAREGRYRLESLALAGVEVNGVATTGVTELKSGDCLRIGEHELRIEEPVHPYHLVIAVAPGEAAAAADQRPARASMPPDLHAAGLGVRRPALLLMILLLTVGLIMPLSWRILGSGNAHAVPLLSDVFWSSGRISNAHAHFGDACQTCHTDLFSKVKNETCTACHAEVAHHTDVRAAAQLPEFAESRCVECHHEHEGAHGQIVQTSETCTDCHADPDRFTTVAMPAAVKNFEDQHPPFTPRVMKRWPDGRVQAQEVALVPGVQDVTGLVFTHQRHLDPAGVLGPDGPEVLSCNACHTADSGGAGFNRIRFNDHCESCHRLSIDAGGRSTLLPHGNNLAVHSLLTTLAQSGQLSSSEAVKVDNFDLRRRPGQAAEAAAPKVLGREELVADVFEFRVCARCHQTGRSADGLPQVRPPTLHQNFFTDARFTHAPHGAVACKDCHQVQDSHSADDLSLPGVEKCQTCHQDADSGSGVATACVNCHRFHRAEFQTLSEALPMAAPAPETP